MTTETHPAPDAPGGQHFTLTYVADLIREIDRRDGIIESARKLNSFILRDRNEMDKVGAYARDAERMLADAQGDEPDLQDGMPHRLRRAAQVVSDMLADRDDAKPPADDLDDPRRPGWYHTAPMVCEQHPDRFYPHGNEDCGGPGISVATVSDAARILEAAEVVSGYDGAVSVSARAYEVSPAALAPNRYPHCWVNDRDGDVTVCRYCPVHVCSGEEREVANAAGCTREHQATSKDALVWRTATGSAYGVTYSTPTGDLMAIAKIVGEFDAPFGHFLSVQKFVASNEWVTVPWPAAEYTAMVNDEVVDAEIVEPLPEGLWVTTTNLPGPGAGALLAEAMGINRRPRERWAPIDAKLVAASEGGCEFVEVEDQDGCGQGPESGVTWRKMADGRFALGPFVTLKYHEGAIAALNRVIDLTNATANLQTAEARLERDAAREKLATHAPRTACNTCGTERAVGDYCRSTACGEKPGV